MARKLSRKIQARKRLVRNQLSSLVLNGKVVTTLPKARVLKSEMEKMIHKVRKLEGISRTRMLAGLLYGGAVKKMEDEYINYKKVTLYKTTSRIGDGAPLGQVAVERADAKATKLKEVKAKNGNN